MFSQRATLDPADGWKSIFKRANGEVWDADWQMYYRRLGESVYALFMVVHWRDELEEASEVYDGIMFQAPLRTDGGAPVLPIFTTKLDGSVVLEMKNEYGSMVRCTWYSAGDPLRMRNLADAAAKFKGKEISMKAIETLGKATYLMQEEFVYPFSKEISPALKLAFMDLESAYTRIVGDDGDNLLTHLRKALPRNNTVTQATFVDLCEFIGPSFQSILDPQLREIDLRDITKIYQLWDCFAKEMKLLQPKLLIDFGHLLKMNKYQELRSRKRPLSSEETAGEGERSKRHCTNERCGGDMLP